MPGLLRLDNIYPLTQVLDNTIVESYIKRSSFMGYSHSGPYYNMINVSQETKIVGFYILVEMAHIL